MDDNEQLSSQGAGWLVAVTLIFLIGGALFLRVSLTLDMVLRVTFFLALLGWLQTYIPRRS
jgi:hypothetical protein